MTSQIGPYIEYLIATYQGHINKGGTLFGKNCGGLPTVNTENCSHVCTWETCVYSSAYFRL